MKTVILLRGLTRESGHWGRFPELLAERIPGLRVVPIDLPGNGRANALRSPNRVDALARAARQQVQMLGLQSPYYLVAMSLGAMVAVEWAVQDPLALGGCVLINTSMRPFSPWYRRLRPANYATLIRVALAMDSEQWREAAILRMTTRHVAAAPAPGRGMGRNSPSAAGVGGQCHAPADRCSSLSRTHGTTARTLPGSGQRRRRSGRPGLLEAARTRVERRQRGACQRRARPVRRRRALGDRRVQALARWVGGRSARHELGRLARGTPSLTGVSSPD